MKAFAALLERLSFTTARDARVAWLRRYFTAVPDPDRGFGLAAIVGALDFPTVKASAIRDLASRRLDPMLFAWSQDFVGDIAETTASMWPGSGTGAIPGLHEVAETLALRPKTELPEVVAGWLDAADPTTRPGLLKWITGAARIGVPAGLAREALAAYSVAGVTVGAIEAIWHSQRPPYAALFAWLEGRGPQPDTADGPVFHPAMRARGIEDRDIAPLDAALYRAEWKWDGLRVQLVATGGGRAVYSREGDDLSAAFPEIAGAMDFRAVLDGALLVVRDGRVAPFADLQQRLNRKTASARMLRDYPAEVRLFDILFDGDQDLRGLAFDARRVRLETWFARTRPARMVLTPTIAFRSLDSLADIRAGKREPGIDGIMLKRAASPYLPGRPDGDWWKWKRPPLTIDAVLMYARRGNGPRTGAYSDFTFGVWRDDGTLVPIGKADAAFAGRELDALEKWILGNTVARFGPVREVAPSLVLEIAFDAAHRSNRRKSGVVLRDPRIVRSRPDKPVLEADRIDTVLGLSR